MKFDYEEEKTEDREVIAQLYWLNGDPDAGEQALCIKTNDPNKFIWMYTTNPKITVQSTRFAKGAIKKFYKGDKITITF